MISEIRTNEFDCHDQRDMTYRSVRDAAGGM